jgi:hypothetical protein
MRHGLNFTVAKSKKLTIIAEEANRKAAGPSPGTYLVKPAIDWGNGHFMIGKDARKTEPDMIAKRNQKLETSTPSP